LYVKEILTDDDFCLALKKSRCVMLKLGIESGDQGVLDQLNKGIDLLTVSAVLKSLKRAGIATYVYLLFRTPPIVQRMPEFFTSNHALFFVLNKAY
jgi:radical SAM superfamily enzyme YgiQ (UPF0313 family)